MNPGLEIERVSPRATVVTVRGDPLGALADDLAATVTRLLGETPWVVVDLSELPVLNSKLLDALVRASAAADPRRGGIAMVAGASYVQQMLEISETGGVVLLADSRAEALETITP